MGWELLGFFAKYRQLIPYTIVDIPKVAINGAIFSLEIINPFTAPITATAAIANRIGKIIGSSGKLGQNRLEYVAI